MRIPFLKRKGPEDLKGIASRVTYIPSGEAAMPRLRTPPPTLEEARAAGERSRRIRANGGLPS
jgi:hypothetical protein